MGEGHGDFPTIEAFDYRETMIFKRRDETTLFYEQRTEKRQLEQTTFLTSHWESGFIRVLETDELELINSQSGGRCEVLIGTTEIFNHQIKVKFVSRALTNDERMVASARTFEVEHDNLRYWMDMQTTRVDKLTSHLVATLRRVL